VAIAIDRPDFRSDGLYTGSMSNASVQSLTHNFKEALPLMEAAMTDCPEDLWQTDLWPNEAPTRPGPHGGLHGSAPWFLGYHALSCLDYDLTGEFEPWNRQHRSTTTRTPFPTACSPNQSFSGTSIGVAAASVTPLTH
jgi:hypothetical protein